MKKSVGFVVGLLLLAGFSGGAAAETPAGQPAKKEMTTEQLKASIIADIDARMKMLQTDRVCVAAAKSKEELKKCAQQAGAKRKELKKARVDVKRELRDKGK